MSKGIKGIIVEIGGDTSALEKALSKVNSKSGSLSKELKGINSLLKLDPSNVELLNQKQTILNESIETTQDKLTQLKKIKEEADKKMADGTKISEENYRNLQREIINTENKLNSLTEELKQFNVANSNITKAGKKVEEYGKKIENAGKKVDELGNKLSIISGAAVAGGTVLANSAMGLEDAVAKYVATTNTAEEETEKYKQVLENINKNNYGEGYEDIANAMSNVTMQLKGLNDTDLQNITEKAIAFRDMFGYEVSESIRAVKALMDNFKISADEAFDLLTEGKKQGLDFSNELLDNVNEYSVQFNKLGLTAEDMFNIFKTGSENGAFNLDKIGDAVKEFSIRAIDGSNTTIDGFKRIGLNADEMAKKFANGGEEAKQAFIEVVNRLGSMDDKVSQSIAGVDLFGTMWEDLGPTVITSFSKMDNGISQSSDSMQKSIDELYDTTKKKAETQLKRLQSLGADFGEEMLPVLEDLIDLAEDFIKKLEGMNDEEKENILKIGLLVAGMGPFTKILGTATKGVGKAAEGIGIFTQAIEVARGKTTSSVTSVNNLAKAFTSLGGQLGIISLVFAGATAATTLLLQETNKNNQAISDSAKEIENTKNKYNEFVQEKDNLMNATLSETENTQKLSDELKTLVDENGKIKDGYKDRVDFILGELNSALGTEYKSTGDLIENYKELTSSVEDLILKKQANAILENEEAKYNEAIKNRTSAYDDMIEKEKQLADAKDELMKKEKEYEDFSNSYLGKVNSNHTNYLKQQVDLQKETIKLAEQNVSDSKEIYKKYLDDIATYENDQAIILSGNEEQIEELIRNRTYTYQQSSNDIGETINHNIQQAQYEIEQYRQAREQDLQNHDTVNAEKNRKQIEAGQKQLETLAKQLEATTSLTQEMTPQQVEAWKNLANNSYDVYSQIVSQMNPDMQKLIQDTTGVIAAGTPQMQEVAGELGQKTVDEFDKSADAKQKALNVLQGYLNGLTDEEKRELLKQAGINNIDAVIDELNRKDLSEESGKSILEGLWNGLKNNSLQKNIIGVAAGLAKSITSSLSVSVPKVNNQELPGHKTGLDYVPYDNYIARLHKGERVLTAKENKQLMSLEKMRNFSQTGLGGLTKQISRNTTNYINLQQQFYPQNMTEAEMKKCSDYMQKELAKYL